MNADSAAWFVAAIPFSVVSSLSNAVYLFPTAVRCSATVAGCGVMYDVLTSSSMVASAARCIGLGHANGAVEVEQLLPGIVSNGGPADDQRVELFRQRLVLTLPPLEQEADAGLRQPPRRELRYLSRIGGDGVVHRAGRQVCQQRLKRRSCAAPASSA